MFLQTDRLFELLGWGTVRAGFGLTDCASASNDVPWRSPQQEGQTPGLIERLASHKVPKTTSGSSAKLAIPLVKDAPAMEALDLSLSARWNQNEETTVRGW